MMLKIGILVVAATLQVLPLATTGNAPLQESFEMVSPPALPTGWISSRNKSPRVDDFVTASGTAHSGSNALLATNATVGQHVTSPVVSFADCIPEQILFFVRRSSSFRAACILEASADSGASFPIQIGDTLRAHSSTAYVSVTVSLPASLAGQAGVRFRWRIVPDQSGTTGTLRLDDITVTIRPSVDRALTSIRIFPGSPVEHAAVVALLTLRNCGGHVTSPARIQIYAQEEYPATGTLRLLADQSWPDTVAPGDSLVLSAGIGFLRPGECRLTGILIDSLDQEHSNDTARSLCTVGFRRESVAINEIMYAPSTPEPEWVEIINRRPEEINLRNWLVSDAAQSARHLLSRTPVRVPPGGFALLTRDSSALMEVHPSVTVPVLAVNGFPSLNNSGDVVVIFDLAGRVMDSVAYQPSWGGLSGESLERVDTAAPGTDRLNWGPSKAGGGSTPGVPNSIARRDCDIALDSLTSLPMLPLVGDTMCVTAWLHNPGRMPMAPGRVEFSCGSDRGGTEWSGVDYLPLNLTPLERTESRVRFRTARSGLRTITASVVPACDEDSSNNKATRSFTAEAPRGGVSINEIMYDPHSGDPEWVELFNCTSESLDVSEWKIGNHSAGSRYRLGGGAPILPPQHYAIVTRDSAWLVNMYGKIGGIVQVPSLPQNFLAKPSDAVVLIDSRNMPVDSVGYHSSWGGMGGISLERRDVRADPADPLNWASSVDSTGGTPGRANSTERLTRDLRACQMTARYDAVQHAVQLVLRVQNDGKTAIVGWGVTYFVGADLPRRAGEPVGRTAVQSPLGSGDSVDVAFLWAAPPPGVHSLLGIVDTAGDERARNNVAHCSVAVPFDARIMMINEIMYDPGSGKAEYVECLNVSSHDVDLNGWKLTDRNKGTGTATTMVIAEQASRVETGGFVTLASDSSIRSAFPGTSWGEQSLLVADRWGKINLGNRGDDLILRDASGTMIDSVRYDPTWHRTGIGDCTGRSLERIRSSSGSNDPRNWSSSVDIRGGTPGRKNSIVADGAASQSILSFSPNPFSPDGDGQEDFALVHYEATADVAVISIRVFDVRGRLIRRLANNEASGRSGERVWDGTDDQRRPVHIGVYIVLFEACDERGNARCTARGAIVVAGRL